MAERARVSLTGSKKRAGRYGKVTFYLGCIFCPQKQDTRDSRKSTAGEAAKRKIERAKKVKAATKGEHCFEWERNPVTSLGCLGSVMAGKSNGECWKAPPNDSDEPKSRKARRRTAMSGALVAAVANQCMSLVSLF
ncbi:hypothetical protein FSPOR_4255 [Fusarium sporotrichioides]|uniref:Uncharacterized protein n=1 Tax=Fusarium sporotrichioides TaxID=5514 RepID=A0A395SCQ0_FUSSP|nr:hypothetical protein FSPOR_4255 [Fusarium sporotrichioides]